MELADYIHELRDKQHINSKELLERISEDGKWDKGLLAQFKYRMLSYCDIMEKQWSYI